jgi:hypothetical protein
MISDGKQALSALIARDCRNALLFPTMLISL